MQRWEGTVEEIVYRNDQSGFTVLELCSDEGHMTAVGCMPLAQVGERIVVNGSERTHSIYGQQIKVDSYETSRPRSVDDMERYLGSGLIKGVGKATAKLLIEHFGEDAFEVIRNNSEQLTQVKGISKGKSELITQSFINHESMREVMIKLQDFDITVNQALKFYKIYGEAAVEVLTRNPYKLISDVEGIGFITADKIAINMGFGQDSAFRIAAGIKYMLDYAIIEGHTYLLRDHLIRLSVRTLQVEPEKVEYELNILLETGELEQGVIEEQLSVFTPAAKKTEQDIANRLLELINERFVLDDLSLEARLLRLEEIEDTRLDETQREAVLQAMVGGVTVITGGPGTGKTTITRFIIKLMQALNMEVELCAPTGRAAKRMGEATGFEARTIHRMLEYGHGDEIGFFRNESYPLECDAIIVDEMSMVDVFLMRQLLKAVDEGTRLVLIGDADQLPSVGAGNVLSDIIRSNKVKTVKLEKIFRQSVESDIVVNAHRINNGKMPLLDGHNDFLYNEIQDVRSIMEKVLDIVQDNVDELDSLRDLQVLSPMKKGELGVINLNAKLQELLNAPDKNKKEIRVRDIVIREGDKIMQTRNNYKMEWLTIGGSDEEKGIGIFNGDIGFVEKIDVKNQTLAVVFDAERLAVFDRADIEDLELAYCVSVHKAQGSEFDKVVLPIAGGAPMLMTRNLLYTALTRARSKLYIVGRRYSIMQMVENDQIKKRYCALAHYLRTQ